MKEYLSGFYRSFPIQLLLLHLRRYQILLLVWVILFGAIQGSFMSTFGADSLFLAPEYLGEVNAVSASLVGMAMAVFVMSWHITTFIIHSRQFKFLATTSKPFLKFYINNSIIPTLFLIYYCYKAIQFDRIRELMPASEIILLIAGFLLGFILMTIISLSYFFGAERTMMRQLAPVFQDPQKYLPEFDARKRHYHEKGILDIEWFFNTRFKLKRPRDVAHYPQEFIDTVFKRHHFSAVISIILAFLFLSIIGLLIDNRFFNIPAASAILLFFAVVIGGAGALVYWLKSWSLPVFLLIMVLLNYLLVNEYIDPRNKAYGLDYTKKELRPHYNQEHIKSLCTPEKMQRDKQHMEGILNRWKARQDSSRPLMYVISVSGGGARSATFTVNVLQKLDSLLQGKLMRQAFVITGASGGMIGAAYYRELYRRQIRGERMNPQSPVHQDAISKDLLNPVFSSYVTRDLFSPAQKFREGPHEYIKDRAYAFEQQLNINTMNVMNVKIGDYYPAEFDGKIPLLIFGSTITADGRKMLISSQPISFLMRDWPDSASGVYGEPDAVDFTSFFEAQESNQLRLLSALRINATFPYVLPNVWLPSEPIIDVMDGGMRDNYGQETMVRFLRVMQDWIRENTSGVVLIQIRDRKRSEWEHLYSDPSLSGLLAKPLMTLNYNWMKIQDYYQESLISQADDGFPFSFRKVIFTYIPSSEERGAALNFHLTAQEKLDIRNAMRNRENLSSLQMVAELIKSSPPAIAPQLGQTLPAPSARRDQ